MFNENTCATVASGNFASHIVTAKNNSRMIRFLVREVNRHKISYSSLQYIFRQVRNKCDLTVPRKPKKLYRLPTREVLDQFFGVIEDPVHQLIFDFLLSTGVREAEMCSLEVSKIDFQKNTAFITGKGDKDRIIILSDRLLDKIRLYLCNRNNRFLFESNRGTRYSTRRIQQLCASYRELARIEIPLTPHTFRHIFNTWLAEAGLSKEHRKLLSGHASDKSQDIYTHLGVAGIAPKVLQTLKELGL